MSYPHGQHSAHGHSKQRLLLEDKVVARYQIVIEISKLNVILKDQSKTSLSATLWNSGRTWIDIDVGAGFGQEPVLLRLDDFEEFRMV